ncbi:hypothetical protein GGF32_000580 [Allomyces javanicus]|nr:hypothetical protein GGF32_000580 [Allomyces javanicus]
MPISVKSLAVFSVFQLPRLPLATDELTVDAKMMHFMDPLPLAPTLKRLVVTAGSDHKADLVGEFVLNTVLQQLPPSLTHLTLHGVQAKASMVAANLATFLPPRLESFALMCSYLPAPWDRSHTDTWPLSLRELDFYGTEISDYLPVVPPGIWVLSVGSLDKVLSIPHGEAILAAWIEALPPSLRVLKLLLDLAACDDFEMAMNMIIEHVRVRLPGRRRMEVSVNLSILPEEVVAKMRAHFDVVDSSHLPDPDEYRWSLMHSAFF